MIFDLLLFIYDIFFSILVFKISTITRLLRGSKQQYNGHKGPNLQNSIEI